MHARIEWKKTKDKADKFGHQLEGYLSNSILFSLPPEFCVESSSVRRFFTHFHTILHLLSFCAGKQRMNSNLSNFRIIKCSSCFALWLKLHLVYLHHICSEWVRLKRVQSASGSWSLVFYLDIHLILIIIINLIFHS